MSDPRRPNTRMQRTRSSPSALRSPLMRCPLGGLVAVATALMSVGCATGRGSVAVRAVDAGGAAIPTVVVRLGSLTATSGVDGLVRFVNVASGRYEVTGDLPGFRACPAHVTVKAGGESQARLMMRFGTIAMVGIVGSDGVMVGSYCEQEFAACPGDPWSAVVVKPAGAEEIENLAK
jgi:hypothetical protein